MDEITDNTLDILWLGDCSGWQLNSCWNDEVHFVHRCGYTVGIPENYLANVLNEWWQLKQHNCLEYPK